MSVFLILAFLFFIGSCFGWVLEVLFRKFFSQTNPEHKWINPGCCKGPYLPLYGCGLCTLYLLARLDSLNIVKNPVLNKLVFMLIMAAAMTAIEYTAGILSIKIYHVRLWDYSKQPFNINGIICPLFSFFWAVLGALYYYLVHPHILDALLWLSENLAFSFFIGMFFGVFIIDFANSLQFIGKLKQFAVDNQVILRYESIKQNIRNHCDKTAEKYKFFKPFESHIPLKEHIKETLDSIENDIKNKKKEFKSKFE